jgi:hypothetical protein
MAVVAVVVLVGAIVRVVPVPVMSMMLACLHDVSAVIRHAAALLHYGG